MSKAKQLPLCPELEPIPNEKKNANLRKKEKWQKALQAYGNKRYI